MEKYFTFEVEDFIVDDFFIRWVLNATDEDNKIWSSWLSANPAEAYKIEQARDIIDSIRFNKVASISQQEITSFIALVKKEHLHEKDNTIPANVIPVFKFSRAWLNVAASIFAAIAVTLVLLQYKKTTKSAAINASMVLQTTNNTTLPLLVYLADRTAVILKPKSTLKYPTAFITDKREVFLSGEAFFEVHKNSKQPFLVHTEEMVTRVVGTSFTVSAYKGAQNFKVIVNTGKVNVYAETSSKKQLANVRPVALIPNEQVIYYRNNAQLIKNTLAQPTVLSKEITQKTFNFRGTPLNEVLKTLREAYQVDIIYNEKSFAACKLTATLDDDPLYDKIATICKAVDANFSLVNGEIVITGNGCNP